MRKVFSGIFIATALLMAQGVVRVTTLADVTGDAATHQVASSGSARWVNIGTLSTNGAVVRVGDSSTTCTTRGQAIAAGGAFFYPPLAADSRESVYQHLYALSGIYYCAGSGDKVTIQWGN